MMKKFEANLVFETEAENLAIAQLSFMKAIDFVICKKELTNLGYSFGEKKKVEVK